MNKKYILSNICDHFIFQENIDDARNIAVDFVIDYFRKNGLSADALGDLICAINSMWIFCKEYENKE